MKQKTRLMAGMRDLASRALMLVSVLAMAVSLAVPVATAADPVIRGVNPKARGVAPPKRIQPAPRLAPAPRVKPNRGIDSRSEFYRQSTSSSLCRSRCGSSCQTISCSGLNTSQCLSIRQQCRMSCTSRC